MDDFVTLLIVRAKREIYSSYALLSSFLHNHLDYGNIKSVQGSGEVIRIQLPEISTLFSGDGC
jgi:hypothetical protein